MRSARKRASSRHDASLQIALILAAVTVFAFAHRLVRVPLSAAAAAVALLVFALLVLFLLLQHGKSARLMLYSRLDSRREPAVIAGFVILVVLVTVYAAVTRQLTPSLLGKTAAVLGLPTLAVWGLRRNSPLFHPWDAVGIGAAWALVAYGWVPQLELPSAQGIFSLIYLATAIWIVALYRFLRPVEAMGLHFKLRAADWRLALNVALIAILVLLTLGFLMGRLHSPGRAESIASLLGGWVLVAVCVALPQEIVFRGILQNLLQKRLQPSASGGRAAIVAVSAWVGLLSLADGWMRSPGLDFTARDLSASNGFLGFTAALFYGWAYQKSGKIWVPALAHTLVLIFFSSVFGV